MVLVGLPASIVTFDEGYRALKEIQSAESNLGDEEVEQ
jgi:hypothetical protein